MRVQIEVLEKMDDLTDKIKVIKEVEGKSFHNTDGGIYEKGYMPISDLDNDPEYVAYVKGYLEEGDKIFIELDRDLDIVGKEFFYQTI